MYTVFRIQLPSRVPDDIIESIGQRFNVMRPGIFVGPHRRYRGLSLDVCRLEGLGENLRALSSFVSDFGGIIDEAETLGGAASFDIAVEESDVRGVPFSLVVPAEISALLAHHRCALEFSLYL